jgi:hypothetical protein
MLENLRQKNPEIRFYSVYDKEFAPFGRVIDGVDASEIIRVAKTIKKPESGSAYVPTEPLFEALPIADTIKDAFYGTLDTQVGYCWGHNSKMDATEWHTCSEINIAVTPIVLILGHLCDIEDGQIDSSKFIAFYCPEGVTVEVYNTSLHYCACQVSDEGFGAVIGLPKNTNTPLADEPKSRFLYRRNKWIIACKDNKALIENGIDGGISGINYTIKY